MTLQDVARKLVELKIIFPKANLDAMVSGGGLEDRRSRRDRGSILGGGGGALGDNGATAGV